MTSRIKALFVGPDGRALWGTDHPGITAKMLRIAQESLDPGEVARPNRALTGPRLVPDQLPQERRVEFWVGGRHPETGGQLLFRTQHAELVNGCLEAIKRGRENDATAPRHRRNVYLIHRDPYESPHVRLTPLPATTDPEAILAAIEAVLDSDQPTPTERKAFEELMPKLEAIPAIEGGDREAEAAWELKRQAEKEARSALRSAHQNLKGIRQEAVAAQNTLDEAQRSIHPVGEHRLGELEERATEAAEWLDRAESALEEREKEAQRAAFAARVAHEALRAQVEGDGDAG